MARHVQTFKDTAGAGTGADGARRAVTVGLAVRLGAAAEVIAFDAPGEPLTFGDTGNIDNIPGFKQAYVYFLSGFRRRAVVKAEFPQVFEFDRRFLLLATLLCG